MKKIIDIYSYIAACVIVFLESNLFCGLVLGYCLAVYIWNK